MGMGVFKVKGKVWNISTPSITQEVELIADTGATYTTLPTSLLSALRVMRVRKIRLRLANGRSVARGLGQVGIEVEGKWVSFTPVVFGDEDVHLLGAVTLEELSLAADPIGKKLVEAEAYLLLTNAK